MEQNTIKAVIEFTDGKTINLNLYPDIAPISVANFVDLAKANFFDGLCFHRVIKDFMIQGGGFIAENGALKPKNDPKTIKGEFKSNGVKNDLSHALGVISMARTNVKDSASSQFFICTADCSFLNGEYAAFGECADDESRKTAVEISKVRTTSVGYYDDVPVSPVVIKTITIQ